MPYAMLILITLFFNVINFQWFNSNVMPHSMPFFRFLFFNVCQFKTLSSNAIPHSMVILRTLFHNVSQFKIFNSNAIPELICSCSITKSYFSSFIPNSVKLILAPQPKDIQISLFDSVDFDTRVTDVWIILQYVWNMLRFYFNIQNYKVVNLFSHMSNIYA